MTPRETAREALIRTIPGWADRPLLAEPTFSVLASPSWRGVDAQSLAMRDGETGAAVFVKELYPDTAFYIDPNAAFDAARKAGDAGIGPKVLAADPSAGILITEYLGVDWRVAGLERATDPAFMERLLAQRSAFASVAPLLRDTDALAEVQSLHTAVRESDAPVPPDMGWAVDLLMLCEAPMREVAGPRLPIHGDGNLSNVLVNAEGDIRLVDFDRAGNGDMLEDLGSVMVEAFEYDAIARAAFARHAPALGIDGEAAFNRARIYGIADDLRWALIAMQMAHLSPRRGEHEFYKFGIWRFLRARIALRDPRFGESLRRLS